MKADNLFYTPQHTLEISSLIKEQLKKYEKNKRIHVPKQNGLSDRTKNLLQQIIKSNKKNNLNQLLEKKLNNQFFDEIFYFFHTLSNIEFNAILFVLQNTSKRRYKDDITNLVIDDNDVYENTIKILELSNKDISKDIKCTKSELQNAYKDSNSTIENFNRFNLSLFQYIERFSLESSLSNLSIRLFYNILIKFSEKEFIKLDSQKMIRYLENYYNIKQQFEFCKYYLSIMTTNNIRLEVLKFIVTIQSLFTNKQNKELEELLFNHYSYSVKLNQKEITLKLAYLLREKLILHAFANDERSNFWKNYAKKCTEAIVFVTSPVRMVLMPFKYIGVIEFIDVGNATFIFDKYTFNTILNRVVNVSRYNDIFDINLNYKYNEYKLKDIIKKDYDRITKIEHRGYTSTWQGKFRNILQRDYNISFL